MATNQRNAAEIKKVFRIPMRCASVPPTRGPAMPPTMSAVCPIPSVAPRFFGSALTEMIAIDAATKPFENPIKARAAVICQAF